MIKFADGCKVFNMSSLGMDGGFIRELDPLNQLAVTKLPDVEAFHLLQDLENKPEIKKTKQSPTVIILV